MKSDSGDLITIEWVLQDLPRQVKTGYLQIPLGTSVQQAWVRLQKILKADMPSPLSTGIWNQRCPLDHILQEGQRLEIYRSLKVDPKEARRLRFQTQGARTAGLFASRRPGARPSA